MKTIGVTSNIQVDLSDNVANRTLLRVERSFDPDWAIITEWDGAVRSTPTHRMIRSKGGGSPLVYKRNRYTFESARTHILVGPGNVGRMPGRKSRLGSSKATVYKLREASGQNKGLGVAIIGIHLTAEVQKGKGYRTDWLHAKRVARHRQEVREINALVWSLHSQGWIVFVAGDTNFAGLTLHGLTSCWEGRQGGTLGNRPVDIIFGPTRGKTLHTMQTVSDHDTLCVIF